MAFENLVVIVWWQESYKNVPIVIPQNHLRIAKVNKRNPSRIYPFGSPDQKNT